MFDRGPIVYLASEIELVAKVSARQAFGGVPPMLGTMSLA